MTDERGRRRRPWRKPGNANGATLPAADGGVNPAEPGRLAREERRSHLGKGDFVGKAALVEESTAAGGKRLAGVEVDWRALQAACERIGQPSPDLGRVGWYTKPLVHGDRVVGRASSLVWGPSVERLMPASRCGPTA